MANNDNTMIEARGLSKQFVLHNQGGLTLPVIDNISFEVSAGECLVLAGPSGAGKSTLLRCLYGNYLCSAGELRVRDGQDWVDLVRAAPRRIAQLRRDVLGYVSQFLRVVPRVAALDIVAEPMTQRGVSHDEARAHAGALLERLNIPARLWSLPPATFSGGEQQRVNIARGFAIRHDILLLDEPTASLDATNREVVVQLIRERVQEGCCVVGIFHDDAVREAVATRTIAIDPISARS